MINYIEVDLVITSPYPFKSSLIVSHPTLTSTP